MLRWAGQGARQPGGAELLAGLGRDPGVGPVGAVDDDLQAREVGAEPLDDVLEVAVRRDAHVVDRPRLALERRVEQRLDLLFRLVGQLLAVAVEDLDPVVLGRVVGRGDDRAEIERQQRDGGCRQHPGEHRVPSPRAPERDDRS